MWLAKLDPETAPGRGADHVRQMPARHCVPESLVQPLLELSEPNVVAGNAMGIQGRPTSAE